MINVSEVTPSPGPKPGLCVICTKSQQEVGISQSQSLSLAPIKASSPSRSRTKNECPSGPKYIAKNTDENAKLFEFLCESLNVNLAKKNAWDFSKENLPLCPSCMEMSSELMEIGVQLLELEMRFERMVERLREMVIESDDKNKGHGPISRVSSTRKRRKKGYEDGQLEQSFEFEDARYLHFRRQVIEAKIRGRRGCKASDPPRREILMERKVKPVNKSKSKVGTGTLHPPPPLIPTVDITSTTRRSQRVQALNSKDKLKNPNTLRSKRSAELKMAEPKVEVEDFNFKANVHHKTSGDVLSVLCKDTAPVPLKNYILKKKQIDESKFEKTKNWDKQPSISVVLQPAEVTESREELISKNDGTEGMESSDDSDSEGPKAQPQLTETRSRNRHWKADKRTGKILFEDIEVIPVTNGFKCSKCDLIITGDHSSKNKQRMKSHLMLKHIERFICLICDKVAANKKYLDFHVKTVHEKSVVVLCTVCEKPFTSKNAMKRHAWNHQNDEEKKLAIAAGKKRQVDNKNHALVECGQCGKKCKGPYNLKRHEETHMDQSARIKHMCQICGALYSAPETLRSHIKLAHENNSMLQWLQCPHCPKKFPQPGRLDKHMRSHTGDKPFICSECGKAFSQQTLLKVHMLKHKNMRPHKCEHCEMSFYRRYHLQRHTQVYHESLNPPSKKQSYRSENGTRKLSLKRSKKKDIKVVPPEPTPTPTPTTTTTTTTTAVIEIARDLGVIIQNPHEEETGSQTLDTHQLVTLVETGPTDATGVEPMQHFSFTSSTSCPYPFSYTFNTTTTTTNESHE